MRLPTATIYMYFVVDYRKERPGPGDRGQLPRDARPRSSQQPRDQED